MAEDETPEDLMRDTVEAMPPVAEQPLQTTPERCDCPALDGPHVHLAGGPERIEAD